MRILQVGKFHFPKGGADKYFLDLSRELERRGHDVACFSMRHPKNEPSKWERYFVPQVNPTGGIFDKLRAVGRPYYSFRENRLFERLILDFRPDVIHVHNICYYLSPSFLSVAKRHRVPVVVHLHDYSLVSPNYLLFTGKGNYDGGKRGRYFECAKDRCFRNSYLLSFLTALEMFFHHRILGLFDDVVAYVAPSAFMEKEIRLWRPDLRNIEVIPHGTPVKNLPERRFSGSSPYFLYVGRLSSEKGIGTLIRAFSKLTPGGAGLKIVGDGPEHAELQTLSRSLGTGNHVEFLGFRMGEELRKIVEGSEAVVVPSEWREVFGLVVIEAMAAGKPVIVSDAGALPEVVGDTGMIFPSGDADALSRCLERVLRDKDSAREMGEKAWKRVIERYAFDRHMEAIENLYEKVISESVDRRNKNEK